MFWPEMYIEAVQRDPEYVAAQHRLARDAARARRAGRRRRIAAWLSRPAAPPMVRHPRHEAG